MPNILPLRELMTASRVLFGPSFWRRPQLKLRTVFWFNGLSNYSRIGFLTPQQDLATASAAQRLDPEHLGILMWPLVDARWPARKRLEMMLLHYGETAAIGPSVQLAMEETRTLVQCAAALSGLSIRLERQGFFRREGQLALSIFHESERIYSVAFLLSRHQGKRVAYVGAIQGVKQSEDNTLYKSITKDAHGLRPRDLAISVFLVFCKALDVASVLAVGNDFRQHRHPYFGRAGKREVFANYDAVWDEHDGQADPQGFFNIPVGIRMRDPESIPSKKRSMYKKRYALLEQIESALCSGISQNKPIQLQASLGGPGA